MRYLRMNSLGKNDSLAPQQIERLKRFQDKIARQSRTISSELPFAKTDGGPVVQPPGGPRASESARRTTH